MRCRRDCVQLGIDFEVIASGSTGNCVRIGNVMIDCGIPYKHLEKELPKVKTLLITHIHSDHVKQPTIESIMKMYPRIKRYGNYEVAYKFPVTPVAEGQTFTCNGVEITPFKVEHDVECFGYVLKMNGNVILYATDCAKIYNPLSNQKYDAIFLESNHDEEKIKQVIGQHSGGYSPYASALRHLSTQKAKAFYYCNRKDRNAPLVELHKSQRFY